MSVTNTVKTPHLRAIDTIYPYEKNAKRHPPEQVKRLATSIKKFGWRGNPIIVDALGVIIAGHGRRLAALELGLKNVPVVVEEDMTAEEARAFRLADNRAAESSIDSNLLKEELIDLDFDLSGIFDDKELNFASADLGMIDESAFIDNLSLAVDAQQQQTADAIEQTDSKVVPVAKVLGFKSFTGKNILAVSRLLALIEAEVGEGGEEGFVKFAKAICEKHDRK